jgi:Transposase, Mutator family
VVATGVAADGHREVLGFDVGDSEDGAFWTAFLRSLKTRGLSGVQLVISDAHAGLKAAIVSVLLGAAWQRCRVHFLRNVPDPADQGVRADMDGRRAQAGLRAAFDPGAADQAEARYLDPDPRGDPDPDSSHQRHQPNIACDEPRRIGAGDDVVSGRQHRASAEPFPGRRGRLGKRVSAHRRQCAEPPGRPVA